MDRIERIERIDRKLAYKGAMLDVYSDTIKTPDGSTVKFDHIHHPGASAIIPVLDNGNILLVRQYRNSLDSYTLEIPAGGIEKGESTIEAASRELEEETGYRCDKIIPFISVVTAVAFCNEVVEVFIANGLTKTSQRLDPEEFINVEEYSLEDIARKVFDGTIQDSKTVSAIMAYIEYIRHTI